MKEMEEYKLNILGLCEICLTDSVKLSSKDKTILFPGSHDGIHHDSVAIILDKSVSKALTQWNQANECLMTARFGTSCTKVTIIQGYAPPNDHEEAEKDK